MTVYVAMRKGGKVLTYAKGMAIQPAPYGVQIMGGANASATTIAVIPWDVFERVETEAPEPLPFTLNVGARSARTEKKKG